MAKTQQKNDDDVAVDQFGRPLPLVVMTSKDGVDVEVRDAAGLSLMHYGYGMEFAEDGMNYAKALRVLLGQEQAREVLVDVPPDGGDIVWHPEPAPDEADDKGDDKGKADSKSGSKSG